MSGTKTISSTAPMIGAISIQQSTYGTVIPIVWGRTRISGNLIWYGDFKATPHTEVTQSGGKGGGGVRQSNTTFTYTASVMMALAEGPGLGIRTAWRGKNVYSGSTYSGTAVRMQETLTYPSSGNTLTVGQTNGWVDVSVELQLGVDYQDDFRYRRAQSWKALRPGTDYTTSNGTYTFSSAACAPGDKVRITYTYLSTNSGLSCLSQIGLTLGNGTPGQAPWSYLTSNHPSQAVGYSNIVYVAGSNYTLNDGAQVENHSFELETGFMYSSSIPDAVPAVIASDGLTNPQYGTGFGLEKLGDLTDYANSTIAQGIFLSPALTAQMTAATFLDQLAQLTNVGLVWSGGVLKFIPYADSPITGNGVTFTPNTTPIYDLTDDDFMEVDDEGPVKVNRASTSDSFNSVRLEILDRANAYNISVVEQADQADIQENGPRPMPVITAHWITDANVAKIIATLILQRVLFIRNTYEFRLGWTKIALEPMDLVTLIDGALGLNKQPVRILSIEEDSDGYLSVVAEDFPKGSATATLYPVGSGSGFAHNFNESPGAVSAPVIFEGPTALSTQPGGLELWLAAGGTSDAYGGCEVWVSLTGSNYQRAAVMHGSSRYGVTTSALGANSAGATTTETLGVSLTAGGQLLAASLTDAQQFASLCYVGGEFIGYETATLTGAGAYTIGNHMVRGGYLSAAGAHASGVPFVRCDAAIAIMPLSPDYIGKTLHVKLLPFNRFGGGLGDLSSATDYTYTVTGSQANNAPLAPTGLATEAAFTATTAKFRWNRMPNAASYNVQIWAGATLAKVREVNVGDALRFDYSAADAKADGGPWRNITIKVQGVNGNGAAGAFATLAVSNPQVGALTGATVVAGPSGVQFSCTKPADVDFAGIQVWMSATNNFTPGSSNLVYDGPNTSVVIRQLNGGAPVVNGTTYYLRAAAYDTFDQAGETLTAQLSTTPSGGDLTNGSGSNVTLTNPTVSGGTIDGSTTSLSNGYTITQPSDIVGSIAATGSTTTIATVTLSQSGGKTPYQKPQWSSNYVSNGGVNIQYSLDSTGTVATIKANSKTSGSNSSMDITVTGFDANGLACTKKFNVYCDAT